ncbi:endonuclease/exonuclease/phosphatase family protein [Lutibacter sp. TH_r2]|uniref:endonuclease/exonuclease/phosphatase family protein n=1 Tax=Lutibacter sp. TH_r2 TaxID=3082083 RepID=UPI0029529682|nr:endonuclease/exonuclease/phosphatase family protein [Lutibacter sp. TH_r2]MDV7186375.1 endonuclease/exonuclease/phosphatase family protein [Lutibacter sp. TH_r2]
MKKYFTLIIVTFFIVTSTFSQEKYKIRTVAFYNLENLFDTENDTLINDEASPIMEMKADRNIIYQKKLENMSKVISEIGVKETNNSPAIIGVVEIENKKVLEDLIATDNLKSKDYSIIHYNSPDLRGIDVALLYQSKYFRPTHHESFELKIFDTDGARVYTRDQLLVSGYLDDELIHIIVNHWPSRRGGEKRSRPSREKAAYLTTQIIEKIKLTDPNPKVLIMGDLNDDPYNSSLKKVLKTKTKKKKVKEGDIYNPYEDMFRRGHNTLVYRDNINLFDQIMFTSPLLTTKKDYSSFKMWKANIFNPQYLTNQSGKYKGYPHRSFVGSNWNGGYSDHYPVYIYLIKEEN